MKHIFTFLLVSFFTLNAWSITTIDDVKFDLRSVTISSAAELYFQAVNKPYIMTDDVLKDQRLASFRTGDLKVDVFFDLLLKQYGFERINSGGLDLIRKRPDDDSEPKTTVVITPRHRTASYISGLIQPLIHGTFSTSREIRSDKPQPAKDVPQNSAAALTEQTADVLVFTGTKKEIDLINKLMPDIDTAIGQVVIKTVIFEVSKGKTTANAFQVLGSLFAGHFALSTGVSSVGDSLTFGIGANMSAIISAINSDSRFKVLSSPSILLSSGEQGKFSVGNSTPTLGAISTSTTGQITQSVVYHDSGLILDVMPTIRDQDISLKVDQELSSFSPTTTGVNGSPTLSKRNIQSTLMLKDGELVVLGSLDQSNDSDTSQGYLWLPDFMNAKSKSNSDSQLMLLIQVHKL